ncbi:Hypothetical_protein [Hexamita inflata]|uniref:Hypothetical_protein n=1 Tax=Hexamita inflata TaxID=28002 RepID=A0AA86QLZ4_9EUKA|nr:Hypothetical protein HINF_LOCUS41830 [Hexamita inflata]CAI9963227.1 Hypothetical protein HINF_LOCUS50872 [Hexamita inflata]
MKSPWTRTITLQKTNYQYNDIIREINVVKQQLGQKSTKIEKQQQMSIEQLENQLQKHINESKVLHQTLIDSDNNMQILYEENYNYQQEINKLKTENQQLINQSRNNINLLDQLQQKYENALSLVDRFKLLIEQMQDDLEISCINASNFINNIQLDNETTYDLINLVNKYHQILNSYEMIPKSDINTSYEDSRTNFHAKAYGVINELVSHQNDNFKQNMNNISQRMQQDLNTFTQTLENQCQYVTNELNSMNLCDETQKDLIKLVTQCYLELNLRSEQLESQLQVNQQLKQQLKSLQIDQVQNEEQTIETAPEIQQIQNGNTIEMKTINEQQSLPQLFTLYQKPLMNDKQIQTNLIQNQDIYSYSYDSKHNDCQQCVQYEEELDQLELEIVDKNQQILAFLTEIQNIYTEKQNIVDKLDYSYIYFNEYTDNKNVMLSRHDEQQKQYEQKSNNNKYYEQSTLKDKLINTKQYFDRQFSELKLKGSINEHHNNNTSILPETQKVLQSTNNPNLQTLEEQITTLKKQQFEDFNYMNVLTLNYKKMESEYQQKIQVQNQIIKNLSIK